MWIEIQDNIQNELNMVHDCLSRKSIIINNILKSMLEGKHIVYISRELINKLLTMEIIDQTNKNYLKWIKEKYVELYSLRDRITPKIIITDKVSEIKVDYFNSSDGERTTYTVPLDWFFCVNATKFLTENESDYHLFLSISTYINSLEKIDRIININLDNDSCHGANVASKLKSTVKENIVLCMLDSDKDMENSRCGDTYKAANNQYKKLKYNSIVHLCSLISREKENLFPPDFYMQICSDKEAVKVLRVLNKFKEKKEIIRYFDIKDGIKSKKNKDKKWNNYYKEVVLELENRNILKKSISDVEDDFVCISGIGEKICDKLCIILFDKIDKVNRELTNCQVSLENKARIMEIREEITKNLPKYIYEEWKQIYTYLFSWGCCINKQYQPYYTM